jgi:hypothetical protein
MPYANLPTIVAGFLFTIGNVGILGLIAYLLARALKRMAQPNEGHKLK